MIRLCIFLVLMAAFGNGHAATIGYFNNANGGKTVLTDDECRQNPNMWSGFSTGSDRVVLNFCWSVWNDKVMLVFPSNNSTYFVPKNEVIKINELTKIPNI